VLLLWERLNQKDQLNRVLTLDLADGDLMRKSLMSQGRRPTTLREEDAAIGRI
jgi:hypothetical protein